MLRFVEENTPKKKVKKRQTSPYVILKRWLEKPLNEDVPEELLKNSISERTLISMFMGIGKVNSFLDRTMNNFYLYSLDRKELLLFVKKIFKDCKIRSNQLHFQKYDVAEQNILKLKKKFPFLKLSDCSLLLEKLLEESDSRTLETLGLKKCTIKKIKLGPRGKTKKTVQQIKKRAFPLEKVLKENFVIQRL